MEKYLDFKNKIVEEELKKVGEEIKKGKVVVFPTETVYGIGTNGLDENAIEQLYRIKQRSLEKPISLLVSDIKMIETLAKDITDIEYKLIKKFFPGPLTIILKKRAIVPNLLTANTDTVGIRMPEGEIVQKLIQYANVPIATPSANISGKSAGMNIKTTIEDFGDKVDCYIDGGECKLGISSTIVKVVDGVPEILREGTIKKEQIYESLIN